jgi:hypothetical protein
MILHEIPHSSMTTGQQCLKVASTNPEMAFAIR